MPTLHRHALSGHAHRAELFASLIGAPVTLSDVDLAAGAHKAAPFLALNPLGQVPVLVEDDGTVVTDSNAILVYLAETRGAADWYPSVPAIRARIQAWLSFAANQIANGPAAARLVTVFGAPFDHDATKAKGHAAIAAVEAALADRTWVAGTEHPSIADVALYSYIAHAPEGGVALDAYPAVRGWLARIEALPGFVPMQATDTTANA